MILLLLVTAVTAFAQFSPGRRELAYDNEANTPLIKVGYPSNGTGYGVRFDPWSADLQGERWVQICTVKVRLCPPPVDGYYQERIYILKPKPDGTPDMASPLWISDPYDVRIGEWWHTIPVTKSGGLWVQYPTRVFVFSLATSGYNCLFQFFDGSKNAPAGTQWFYNGATFSQYANPNVGDIMIHMVIQKHDFAALGIVRPVANVFRPRSTVMNVTGFAEEQVPLHFWIKTVPGGAVVYDQRQMWDAPAELSPEQHDFYWPLISLPDGDYTAYTATEYHGSAGNGYPFRYERNTTNDLVTLNFTLESTKGKAPRPKTQTE